MFCVKKNDINLFIFVLDLFKSVKERFGCLDIVCNNAGVGGEVYPLWERTVDVNVVKNVHVLHVLFKLLISMEPNIWMPISLVWNRNSIDHISYKCWWPQNATETLKETVDQQDYVLVRVWWRLEKRKKCWIILFSEALIFRVQIIDSRAFFYTTQRNRK